MASYSYGRSGPPVFKETGGWELREKKFTVEGYDRIEGKYLRDLFGPVVPNGRGFSVLSPGALY